LPLPVNLIAEEVQRYGQPCSLAGRYPSPENPISVDLCGKRSFALTANFSHPSEGQPDGAALTGAVAPKYSFGIILDAPFDGLPPSDQNNLALFGPIVNCLP